MGMPVQGAIENEYDFVAIEQIKRKHASVGKPDSSSLTF